jgi:hypothetical protein
MFELVIEYNGVEQIVFSGESRRIMELVRQRHVRSLCVGTATIREAAAKKK